MAAAVTLQAQAPHDVNAIENIRWRRIFIPDAAFPADLFPLLAWPVFPIDL